MNKSEDICLKGVDSCRDKILLKADLLGSDPDCEDPFAQLSGQRLLISAVSGRGLGKMVSALGMGLEQLRREDPPQAVEKEP